MRRLLFASFALTALASAACAPSGYVYEVGNFVRPHPTQALCASRSQVLDMRIEDCVSPTPPPGASAPLIATAAQITAETYESDRAWSDRIKHGACTRLHDARTDAPADVAECNHDYAIQPPCIHYQGFAYVWFDLAENPVPGGVSTIEVQTNVINNLGSKNPEEALPYVRSPQFRNMLQRLLSVTFSPERKKWGNTREQFSDHAYKICMEGHPF